MTHEGLNPYPDYIEQYSPEAFEEFTHTVQAWATLPWAWGENAQLKARAERIGDYAHSPIVWKFVSSYRLTKDQLTEDIGHDGAIRRLREAYEFANEKFAGDTLLTAQVHILRLTGTLLLERVKNSIPGHGPAADSTVVDIVNAGLAFMKADELMHSVTMEGKRIMETLTAIEGFRDLSIFVDQIGAQEVADLTV